MLRQIVRLEDVRLDMGDCGRVEGVADDLGADFGLGVAMASEAFRRPRKARMSVPLESGLWADRHEVANFTFAPVGVARGLDALTIFASAPTCALTSDALIKPSLIVFA